MSGKDAKAQIWNESDEKLAGFVDSECDEIEVDDNNVYAVIRMIVMEGFVATYRKNGQETPSDSNVNNDESNKSQGMPDSRLKCYVYW